MEPNVKESGVNNQISKEVEDVTTVKYERNLWGKLKKEEGIHEG